MRKLTLLFAVALVCTFGAQGITITVNQGGGADFTALAPAIDAALIAVNDPDGIAGPLPNADVATIVIQDSAIYDEPINPIQTARSTWIPEGADILEANEEVPITITSNAATASARPIIRPATDNPAFAVPPYDLLGGLAVGRQTAGMLLTGANGVTFSNLIFEWHNGDYLAGPASTGNLYFWAVAASEGVLFENCLFRALHDGIAAGIGEDWGEIFNEFGAFGFLRRVTMTFRDCEMDGTGTNRFLLHFISEIDPDNFGVTFERCWFHDFNNPFFWNNDGAESELPDANNMNLTVTDTLFTDCQKGGVDSEAGMTVLVDRCIFNRVATGPEGGSRAGAVGGDRASGANDVTVRNCVFRECGDAFNAVPAGNLGVIAMRAGPRNYTVVHNTFDGCGVPVLIEGDAADNILFANNIVYDCTGPAVYVTGHAANAATINLDTNLFELVNKAGVGGGGDVETGAALVNLTQTRTITGDPAFVANSDNPDLSSQAAAFADAPYDLEATSAGAAVSQANVAITTASGGATDVDGDPRLPGDGLPDLGAQEVNAIPPAAVDGWREYR